LQHAPKHRHFCLDAIEGFAGEGIDNHSRKYKPTGVRNDN
jgi:hypothetical protein